MSDYTADNTVIEQKIKRAVEKITPDVLDEILIKCDAVRQNTVTRINTIAQKNTEERQSVARNDKERRYTKTPASAARFTAWRSRAVGIAGALAAVLVLVFGGLPLLRYIVDSQLYAVLTLDANPSITLNINRVERVIDAIANNDDAVTVLDGMDLRDTPVDVAVNALIGSMLKYGYIRGNANTVLLSVDSDKNLTLQSTLTKSISQQLNVINGAVISQKLQSDDTLSALAEENGISFGKASLVQKILNENSHLLFSDLAKLSVNELNLLVSTKQIAAEGLEAEGSASETAYIGMENALMIALSHAGISESGMFGYSSEFDCDDGIMVYDVEFNSGDVEYEYEIDAKTGDIIEYDHDKKRTAGAAAETASDAAAETAGTDTDKAAGAWGDTGSTGTKTAAGTEFIGEESAKAIALAHSGNEGAYRNIKAKLDKDDGIYIYEIEIDVGSIEYDYEIDALTGEILSYDAEE